jgi:hypothetical protein
MTTRSRTLTIVKGASFTPRVTWKNRTTGLPFDLTGASVAFVVRTREDAPDALLELSTSNGGIVPCGSDGVIQLDMPPSATQDLAWKSGVYTLTVTFADASVRRILRGPVLVEV